MEWSPRPTTFREARRAPAPSGNPDVWEPGVAGGATRRKAPEWPVKKGVMAQDPNGSLRTQDEERVARLEQRLGVSLGDRAVALAALTHKSYVNEHRDKELEDNERLEFLGDAVVDLAVSDRLMQRFPLASEGDLSRLRATLVDEGGLAQAARAYGLGELLLLGRGEELSGGRDKPSLLADALEAVIGAVYLAGGMPAALDVIDRIFSDAFAQIAPGSFGRDHKTALQELAQSRHRASPKYRVISELGPDHSKTFVVEVELSGQVFGQGEGRSKKDAEQAAARVALAALQSTPNE
jgi:ribonuclease-3